MNTNFYFFFLMVPYLSWSFTYFSTHLLTPRKKIRCPEPTLFVVSFLVILLLSIVRMYAPTVGVNAIQIYLIFNVLICFQEKFSRKLSCYIFYKFTGVLVEAISASVFTSLRNLMPVPTITVSEITYQTGLFDIIGISVSTTLIGVLFFRKEVSLLKKCFSALNVRTFFQLIIPLLVPALAQGIIINQSANPQFLLLSAIYWLLCLICYPLFLFGVHALRKQGQKRQLQTQQLLIMKAQLAFSQQSEEEYAALRKWNHDSENHLLALAYLMDMEKYEEAKEYYRFSKC